PTSHAPSPAPQPQAPPQPQPLNGIPIESEFDRAVKSFAQFFNGQVVSLDDDAAGKPSGKPSGKSSNENEQAEDSPSYYMGPDSDVPF
ncbi:MAG TPA: hypothetical protein V6D06_15460, partial [Trichocoleus sp.]